MEEVICERTPFLAQCPGEPCAWPRAVGSWSHPVTLCRCARPGTNVPCSLNAPSLHVRKGWSQQGCNPLEMIPVLVAVSWSSFSSCSFLSPSRGSPALVSLRVRAGAARSATQEWQDVWLTRARPRHRKRPPFNPRPCLPRRNTGLVFQNIHFPEGMGKLDFYVMRHFLVFKCLASN